MNRRDLMTLIGGAVAWPLAARAQQTGSLRRIGVLLGIAKSDPQGVAGLSALTKGLAELGWTDGRNVQIDYRFGGTDVGGMQNFAEELISLKPDVLLGQATSATAALQRETKTIPIVFVLVSDPVGSGFVASLPRPGGNITGFINFEDSLSGKWVQILKDVAPGISRAALLFNPDTAPYFRYYLQSFERAAQSGAIEPVAAAVAAHQGPQRDPYVRRPEGWVRVTYQGGRTRPVGPPLGLIAHSLGSSSWRALHLRK